MDAILAAGGPAATPDPEAGSAVGARIARVDGWPKGAGTERFGADAAPHGALWLRAVRSPHARATFTLGDLDAARRRLPGLVPEPYAEATCLFTSTPTEDFLIDGADGITLVSPCSGHGAKFAPLIGDIAADVATGTATAPDRFGAAGFAAAGRRA